MTNSTYSYERRVLCFLDILGFKSIIAGTVDSDGNGDSRRITNLADVMLYIRYILSRDDEEGAEEWRVTQFSDSIVISFPYDQESGVFDVLLHILWVTLNFVMNGILCRGAIVEGNVLHTDDVLFGPAMNEAYRLESKVACYPRVVLAKSLIDLGSNAHAWHHDEHHERQGIMELLEQDTDGYYYIEYIKNAQGELDDPEYEYPLYLTRLRSILAVGLQDPDPEVRKKYIWLRDRFAPHLTGIKNSVGEAEIDDEVRAAYLSIADLPMDDSTSTCSKLLKGFIEKLNSAWPLWK